MIIIPDVHGRTFWRQAVNDYLGKEHILFLGDYLDPYAYEGIKSAGAYKVFHEIIGLKKDNPDDITLLLGNHDLHYLNSDMEGGRMDYTRRERIIKDITDNANLFRIAELATIGGKKYLFTHAGVKKEWIQGHQETLGNPNPVEIADRLNTLWLDLSQRPKLLNMLADVPYSRWGNSPYGSPVWNDVSDMFDTEEDFPELVQVFGHSQQMSKPVIREHYMCLDVRCAFRLSEENAIPVAITERTL